MYLLQRISIIRTQNEEVLWWALYIKEFLSTLLTPYVDTDRYKTMLNNSLHLNRNGFVNIQLQ
jgi:hypothetical protein